MYSITLCQKLQFSRFAAGWTRLSSACPANHHSHSGPIRAHRYFHLLTSRCWCCGCLVQTFNPFGRSNQTFRYWEEDELKDLVAAVGLTDYTRTRSRMFIMFAATKPAAERQPEQW